jgi:hypothetical protein
VIPDGCDYIGGVDPTVEERNNGDAALLRLTQNRTLQTKKEPTANTLAAAYETPRETYELDLDSISTPDMSPAKLREYMGRGQRSDSIQIDEQLSMTAYPLPGAKLLCFDGDQTVSCVLNSAYPTFFPCLFKY